MRSRLPISMRLLLLTALATSTTIAMPASFIFGRATCSSDQVSCSSQLPSNFCCPKGSNCIALAGNTTAVCCPEGDDCSWIEPITCDVSAQDPDLRPSAPIKTTVFNVDLEKCGSACCPFGYKCKDKECVMDDDQSEAPNGAASSTTASATSATATETETVAATASSTDGPTASVVPGKSTDSQGDSSSSKDSAPATTSIIGGVVGACLILLIIAIIVFLYIRRKKKADSIRSEKSIGAGLGISRAPSSAGSFGNVISDPIPQPGSYRADFIRKSPSRASDSRASTLVRSESSATRATHTTHANRIQHTPPRIRISIPNPFDSPNPSPNNLPANPSPPDEDQPRHGTVRLPPIRAMKASSHCSARPSSHELHKEPSSESINVFADPGTVKARPLTRATTFTDLMDEADLGEVQRGRPYVPGTTPRI